MKTELYGLFTTFSYNTLVALLYALNTYGIGYTVACFCKPPGNIGILKLFMLRWVLGWTILTFIIHILGVLGVLNTFVYIFVSFVGILPFIFRGISGMTGAIDDRKRLLQIFTEKFSKLFKCKFAFILLLSFIVLNYIVALAPVSKDDELGYHYTFLKRTVSDGGIYFDSQLYQTLTPMAQQLWYVPVYGLGALEAPSILNLINAVFVAFIVFLWLKKYTTEIYAWLGVLVSYITLSGVVLHSVPTDNLAGWFWSLATLILLYEFLYTKTKWEYGYTEMLLLGLVFASAAAAKIVNYPLTFFATLIVFIKLLLDKKNFRYYLCLFFPMLIFITPFLLRLYLYTGNPFFPVLDAVFPSPVYDRDTYNEIASRIHSFPPDLSKIQILFKQLKHNLTLGYSPMFALLTLIGAIISVYKRKWALFFCGCLIPVFILKYMYASPRLFRGYFLFLCLIPFVANARIIKLRLSNLIIFANSIFLICIAGIYGVQFGKYVFGFESRNDFYHEKVQAYEDIQWVNQNLPLKSKVLSTIREKYFFDTDVVTAFEFLILREKGFGKIEDNKALYELLKKRGFTHLFITLSADGFLCLPEQFRLQLREVLENHAHVVYQNDEAIVNGVRHPLRQPAIGKLKIYELL
jgi:hypothetical protein